MGLNGLQRRSHGTSLSEVKHLCHLKISSRFKKLSLMVVILSLIRNLIMPSVGIVLIFFCHVDVLEDELMAEGNQNEQPPWVPVKMNEGKHSTDLSQLDQRNRAFTSTRDTSCLGGLVARWIMSMLGLSRSNVTKCHRGRESRGAPILSI